jgi:LmbE family N-acetylglucosaminyl deacetylase
METTASHIAGPLREQEQIASCRSIGVTELEFPDHSEGAVVADVQLRLDIARAMRKHRPEVLISINFRESWGGPSWNHAGHRAVGLALLGSVRDTANSWVAQDLEDPACDGVRFVAFNASPQSTHSVDVTATVEDGVRSLLCHREYLRSLGQTNEEAAAFLRAEARDAGSAAGAEYAAQFEVLRPWPQGRYRWTLLMVL